MRFLRPRWFWALGKVDHDEITFFEVRRLCQYSESGAGDSMAVSVHRLEVDHFLAGACLDDVAGCDDMAYDIYLEVGLDVAEHRDVFYEARIGG